jgi:hypothetical protein
MDNSIFIYAIILFFIVFNFFQFLYSSRNKSDWNEIIEGLNDKEYKPIRKIKIRFYKNKIQKAFDLGNYKGDTTGYRTADIFLSKEGILIFPTSKRLLFKVFEPPIYLTFNNLEENNLFGIKLMVNKIDEVALGKELWDGNSADVKYFVDPERIFFKKEGVIIYFDNYEDYKLFNFLIPSTNP